MKLQINSNEQATITVPKNLWKAKRWEDGQELEFVLDNEGNLVLKEVE